MMELITLDKTDYKKAYDLFLDVFVLADVRKYDTYLKMLDEGIYQLLGVKDDQQEIQAALLLIELDDFYFVENLAVNKKYQNKGIGSFIIQTITSNKRIVLEVEDDELLTKRIKFYQRNGLSIYQDEFYYLPAINDEVNPNKMFLMSNFTIDQTNYSKIKKTLFQQVYNQ